MRVAGDWGGENEFLVACAGEGTVMVYQLWPKERGDACLGEHPSDHLFSFFGDAFDRVAAEVAKQRAAHKASASEAGQDKVKP